MIITVDDRKTKRKLSLFSSFRLDLRYDSVGSTFEFGFYYNPENPDHRLIAQIGKYQLARVEHNGQLMLTGFILKQKLTETAEDPIVSFSGYSVPGVLEDSDIPESVYPLQFDGLSLRQITEKILAPFVIKYVVDPEVSALMDEVFEKITADPTQTVKDFLTELAKQKNIIISHTANGRLLFTRCKTNQQPIFHFESGLIGTTLDLEFDGQGMHTPIMAMKQASKNSPNAGQYTVKNPYVPEETTAFRPKTVLQSSGDDNDTEKVARNALASELKNIKLSIDVDRWDLNNKLIVPNSIISVRSPKLFINRKTNFFVESVSYAGTPEAMTASLGCVLPEVYNGKTPKNIFF